MTMLIEGFDEITEWTGDGTVWSFPWDQMPEDVK